MNDVKTSPKRFRIEKFDRREFVQPKLVSNR
jgi:hypothetical protein